VERANLRAQIGGLFGTRACFKVYLMTDGGCPESLSNGRIFPAGLSA